MIRINHSNTESQKSTFILCVLGVLLTSCVTYRPEGIKTGEQLTPLDYSQMELWAAHPAKLDKADLMPEGDTVLCEDLKADVFFIHPTTYTGTKRWQKPWNGPVDNAWLNAKTDNGSIQFQASAFNHAGRVFAPRYRQAHIEVYYTRDSISAYSALDAAYEDVRNAFNYYLSHENHGRPVIIAAHSQGTNHAVRLLNEFFTRPPMEGKLIAAYLIGMPIKNDQFKHLLPCKDSSQTNCFVSWRTFQKGYELPQALCLGNVCVTNPLTWDVMPLQQPKELNQGSLLWDFHQIHPQLVDAQIYKDILWASKPRFFGSLFLTTRNYHVADINFYYLSVRENAEHRSRMYLQKQKK